MYLPSVRKTFPETLQDIHNNTADDYLYTSHHFDSMTQGNL